MSTTTAPVVVLNASYEPLGVVAMQRAMIHVIAERADIVIADGDSPLRAGRTSFERPLAVAFREYVRIPLAGRRVEAAWRRPLLLQRDDRQCAYCSGRGTTVDHILPQSRGGGNTWMNTVAACLACNGRKDDRTPSEAGMELRFNPRIVYREEIVMLAVKRVAASSGRMDEFAQLVPALAAA